MSDKPKKIRIGDLLIQKEIITEQQLEFALQEQISDLRKERADVKRIERRENTVKHMRRMRWNPFAGPSPTPLRRSNRRRSPIR